MGTTALGATSVVTLHVDATDLTPGNYVCNINLYTNDPYQRAVTVPVYFTVEEPVGIAAKSSVPKRLVLEQNYPNPFNPTTTIRYQLPVAAQVELQIYDILGRPVRDLVNERQKPGYYEVQWDGTNDAGEPVSSGVYLYRLIVNQASGKHIVKTQKMMLLK